MTDAVAVRDRGGALDRWAVVCAALTIALDCVSGYHVQVLLYSITEMIIGPGAIWQFVALAAIVLRLNLLVVGACACGALGFGLLATFRSRGRSVPGLVAASVGLVAFVLSVGTLVGPGLM